MIIAIHIIIFFPFNLFMLDLVDETGIITHIMSCLINRIEKKVIS